MQNDSQAFHAQWKALPQSVALSFAASKCRQNRQIPHTAGYPAYVNTGMLNTRGPFSSIAFFFSLYLGLCSPTEFYKSAIQSKSILKVHSGPKRSEQAIDLPLGLSKRVPFLNCRFSRITRERKPGEQTELLFSLQWWCFRSTGLRCMQGGLAHWSSLAAGFVGFFSFLGMDREGNTVY